MPRKSAAEIEQEAQELQAKAKQLRAEERKAEKRNAGYIQRLLGVYLEHVMKKDPSLRARVASDMRGFCRRPRDRELFRLDERETYFDRLCKSPEEQQAKAKSVEATTPAEASKQAAGAPAAKPKAVLPPPAVAAAARANGHGGASGAPGPEGSRAGAAVAGALQTSGGDA